MSGSESTQSHGVEARRLMRRAGYAALATSLDGAPYASLVAVACDIDASPLLLLSNLAQHTRNLLAEAQVSLLFDGTRDLPDPLAGPRLTLLGRAGRCDDERALARFVAHHPLSAAYAGFGDFHLYRVDIERAHLVAGFGRIFWIERDELRIERAERLAQAEPDIVAHMNADHADAVALYAARLLRRSGAGWRMTGIDPDGFDLARDGETARLDFPRLVLTPAEARSELVALAAAARNERG